MFFLKEVISPSEYSHNVSSLKDKLVFNAHLMNRWERTRKTRIETRTQKAPLAFKHHLSGHLLLLYCPGRTVLIAEEEEEEAEEGGTGHPRASLRSPLVT